MARFFVLEDKEVEVQDYLGPVTQVVATQYPWLGTEWSFLYSYDPEDEEFDQNFAQSVIQNNPGAKALVLQIQER